MFPISETFSGHMKLPTHPSIIPENTYQKRKSLISKVSPQRGKQLAIGNIKKL